MKNKIQTTTTEGITKIYKTIHFGNIGGFFVGPQSQDNHFYFDNADASIEIIIPDDIFHASYKAIRKYIRRQIFH